jgi:phytoene dehydrogenase-like protein
MRTANIIGSGPNGLAAAITLAQAGFLVNVFERNATLGGACATAEITLPGFHHDLGASAFPMGAASPFFHSLPLEQHGLRWCQPELPLAHPLDDGSAVALTPTLDGMFAQLPREDATAWKRFFNPIVRNWDDLVPDLLSTVLHIPRHPLSMARFGLPALLPATTFAHTFFSKPRAHALFAGCAAHSVMPLESPLSSAIGIVLAAAGHTVGWPVACGGSQAITNALAAHLQSLGGTIHPNQPIDSIDQLPPADLTFFDTSAEALERIAGTRFTEPFRASLRSFKSGPGVFKVDWALSEPIPWTAESCRRAGTIHVGGTLEEIARAEADAFAGKHSDKPFVLLVQPSVADTSRAPEGKHTAWGYCHVPNGSTVDRTEAIEAQVTRFAPGFRDVILARRTQTTAQLESWNPNLLGGDLSGGAMSVGQLLFRPTARDYATTDPTIFLCSSSTPPGGGVHGMCGHRAAQLALKRLASSGPS